MKIADILTYIASGSVALSEFQRGYVWNGEQVRGLFDSLYKRHPIGGLLVWATETQTTEARGDGFLAPGIVKFLLDGQQRITVPQPGGLRRYVPAVDVSLLSTV